MNHKAISRFITVAATLAVSAPTALVFLPTVPVALAAQPAAGPLGDLSSYRAIAENTLSIVNTGDIATARKRIKDLETAWDKAEPKLKAKDKKVWTALDEALDEAFAALRTPNAKPDDCATALQKLLVSFDTYNQ